MTLPIALFRLLIFPGLLFAIPAGWFFLWIERKAVALSQGRLGPPFMQPFYDFMKLMGKASPRRSGLDGLLIKLWPVLSLAAMAGALSLLPVVPHAGGFSGDLVLLIALLELPSFALIAAGFSSKSLFGEIGSAREAALSVAYNVLFLVAVIAIGVSQNTFQLDQLAQGPHTLLRWFGVIAIAICVPAKLHINPFSLPDAEQEIYAGPMTEYAGAELALWELAHAVEWVATIGLVACLAIPWTGNPWIDVVSFLLVCIVIVVLLAGLAASTARLTIDTSVRFYWRTGVLALVALSTVLLTRIRV